VIEIEWTEVDRINSDEVLQISMQNRMVLTRAIGAAEAGMEISASPGAPNREESEPTRRSMPDEPLRHTEQGSGNSTEESTTASRAWCFV